MIALTVDIEDWYHIPPVTGSPFARFKDTDEFFRKWETRYDYLTEPTITVLDLLEEYDLKATFFVVADVTEHYPGLVERIAARGHEIACHGLHHACKIDPGTKRPLMTGTEFKDRTLKAKSMLEKASGQKVIGYRAPSAYIAGWMIDILHEIGFKYDSSVSVNSFYNKSDSRLKNVGTQPYYPARDALEDGDKKSGIMEIPWPYFQFIARFPTAGGPVMRLLGSNYIMLGLRQSAKKGDTLFYFHPIDIGREKIPLDLPLVQQLLWRSKGKTNENRVRQILSQIRGDTATCRQILLNQEALNEY